MNKKRKTEFCYKTNEKVLLKKNIRDNKLEDFYEGPHSIIEISEDKQRLKILMPNKIVVTNVKNVVPFVEEQDVRLTIGD